MTTIKNTIRFLLFVSVIYFLATTSIVKSQSNTIQIFLPLIITPPGSTTLVSISSDNIQGAGLSQDPAISADGRYIAFQSYANNLVPDDGIRGGFNEDIFIHDRQNGNVISIFFVVLRFRTSK